MSLPELFKCLEMGLIFGIVAVGIYLTFRTIDFPDLTCDGSFVLGAAVTAILLKLEVNPYAALGAATAAGGLAGTGTGLLHTRFNITPLLSGILISFMLYSINLDVMKGSPNIVLMDKETLFSHNHSILVLGTIATLILAGFSYLLSSDFGLALKSIGQNKRLASNSGINVATMTLIGLALSNGLIALGGGLFCQLEGFADITVGVGTVIFGLAAVMIGEKILPVRHVVGALAACFIGSILYRILVSVALNSEWIGLRTKDLNLVTGILVVLVMQLPVHKMKARRAHQKAL